MSPLMRTSPDTVLNHHLRNHSSLGPGSWTGPLRKRIPLHLELADLLVQPGDQGGVVPGLLILTLTEDAGGAFGEGFFQD